MTTLHPQLADAELASRQTKPSPWWQGASIYQIYPRSFFDTTGNGIGDLRGITNKLDYVADLGVDGIWLSPFFTSPMRDFGYDVSNYCDVDQIFGTLSDFDKLVARAHSLKLKVVIDQVYSHTSDKHDWFSSSRDSQEGDRSDWYVWANAEEDGSPPNNWMSVFGGPAWTWDARRRQYYLHHFLKEQPTLNLHNEAVIDALISVGEFWIERGVDGFRLDALNVGMHDRLLRSNPAHPNSANLDRPYQMQVLRHNLSQPEMIGVVEKLSQSFRAAGGEDFFTVGELGGEDPLPVMEAYTHGLDRLSSAYSFEFIGTKHLDTKLMAQKLGQWTYGIDSGHPSWALSNHDCPRVASRWAIPGVAEEKSKRLLCLFQMALPGIVFVYQGEELGLPQAKVPYDKLEDPEGILNWPLDQGRDGARTPMPWVSSEINLGFSSGDPWLPVYGDHGSLSADQQLGNQDSFLHFYRDALALRQTSNALRQGDYEELAALEDALVFARSTKTELAVCALNFGSQEVKLPSFERGQLIRQMRYGMPCVTNDTDTLAPLSGFIAVYEK